MLRALLLAVLIIAPSGAEAFSKSRVTASWSSLWSTSVDDTYSTTNMQKYGCGGTPSSAFVRPGFIAYYNRRMLETSPYPIAVWNAINAVSVTDGDATKWQANYADVMRLLVRDYGTAAVKPEVVIDQRQDVRRPTPVYTTGANARTQGGQPGCDASSNSWSGTDRNCTDGNVPMCASGVNADKWCPFHDGGAVDEETWCPGSSCTLRPWDWSWTLTIPTATNAADVAEYTAISGNVIINPTGIKDRLCDGTEFALPEDCGAGYPGSAANLPANSIGKTLYDDQGVWPLASVPAKYVHAMSRGCVGGDNPGTACTDGAAECTGAPAGTCPPDVCVGGANDGEACPDGDECAYPGVCGGTNTVAVHQVGVDVRIPAAQDFLAAEAIDKAYHTLRYGGATEAQIQDWPVGGLVLSKDAWWARYDRDKYYLDATPACTGSIDDDTGMWHGPSRPGHAWTIPCGVGGTLLSNTPYAPGEYEAGANAIALKMVAQTGDGAKCSADSIWPYKACSVNSDCGQAGTGTCEASANRYFNNTMSIYSSQNPDFRDKKTSTASQQLRATGAYKGVYEAQTITGRPWFRTAGSGAAGAESLCTASPESRAGGDYAMPTGGAVRLIGSCTGPYDVTPAWTITAGTSTGCAFVDPFDLATAATADPQATLEGCSVAGTITAQLDCGGVTDQADIVISSLCGDGAINGSETCDDGSAAVNACVYGDTSPYTQVCNGTCSANTDCASPTYCGDSAIQGGNGETCDDGNTTSSDGCSATCQTEVAQSVDVEIDVGEAVDGYGVLTTDPFSTTTADDLLVAFVAHDGPVGSLQSSSVSSSPSMTWTLAGSVRANAGNYGDVEIWSTRVFGTLTNATVTATPSSVPNAGSLNVVAFRNADGIGDVAIASALTGQPAVSVPNVAIGSWVWAVGDNGSAARDMSPVSGQTIQHEDIATQHGVTLWTQSTTVPSTSAGTVAISTTGATEGDHWHMAGVEILLDATPAVAACADDLDNDGDGGTDFGIDAGCTSFADTSEREASGAVCDNGIDEDIDGSLDYPLDTGCTGPTEANERGTIDCDDGADDDADTWTDFPTDPGCASISDTSESNATGPDCDDGSDNDTDTFTDFPADAGCANVLGTIENPECNNGADDADAEDSLIDLADPGCTSASDPSESNGATACNDGADNDSDGIADYPGDAGCTTPMDPDESGDSTLVVTANMTGAAFIAAINALPAGAATVRANGTRWVISNVGSDLSLPRSNLSVNGIKFSVGTGRVVWVAKDSVRLVDVHIDGKFQFFASTLAVFQDSVFDGLLGTPPFCLNGNNQWWGNDKTRIIDNVFSNYCNKFTGDHSEALQILEADWLIISGNTFNVKGSTASVSLPNGWENGPSGPPTNTCITGNAFGPNTYGYGNAIDININRAEQMNVDVTSTNTIFGANHSSLVTICYAATGGTEISCGTLPRNCDVCMDGLDNDSDGLFDWDDTGCTGPTDATE